MGIPCRQERTLLKYRSYGVLQIGCTDYIVKNRTPDAPAPIRFQTVQGAVKTAYVRIWFLQEKRGRRHGHCPCP